MNPRTARALGILGCCMALGAPAAALADNGPAGPGSSNNVTVSVDISPMATPGGPTPGAPDETGAGGAGGAGGSGGKGGKLPLTGGSVAGLAALSAGAIVTGVYVRRRADARKT